MKPILPDNQKRKERIQREQGQKADDQHAFNLAMLMVLAAVVAILLTLALV